MKKILSLVLIAMLLMSCAFAEGALRVGLMPSAVGAPVQLALESGYFTDEGLDIEMVIFANGAAINEAMMAGELDVACSGAATVFALASGMVTLIGDSEMSGGMGIWVKPDSDILTVKGQVEKYPEMHGSADTIKGKTIVCSLGTASQFNVLRYLEQFGLTDQDITLVNMDWSSAVQAFLTDEVDAIATFAPYSNQAEAGGGVKICTFEDATETALYDMIFARNDVIEERRDDVVKFLRAYYHATEDFINDEAMRAEWCMKWFASEGRTYDDETMAQEIKDRPYPSIEFMLSEDYILGEAMYDYAAFNVGIGKIEDWQMDAMETCYDASLISEAIGGTVRQPEF